MIFLILGINLGFVLYIVYRFNTFKKRHIDYLKCNELSIKSLISELDSISLDIQNIKEKSEIEKTVFIDENREENTEIENKRKQPIEEKVYTIVKNKMSDSDFSITTLQKELTVSKTKCYKIIKEATDMSPGEFITHVKMKEAQDYIRNTDLTISEIAYSVGYADPKYFSKVFKKAYGETPVNYRKKVFSTS